MRVLLVVNGFHWAFGQIADAICRFNPDIDFLYANFRMLHQEPEEFRSLVHQSDVIHWITNVAHAGSELATWSLRERPSVASVYHVTEDELYKLEDALQANVIHVISSEWETFLSDRHNVSPARIELILPGVDTTLFQYRKPKENPGRPFRIGFFGDARSYDRKGIDIFLRTCKGLDERGFSFQAVLTGPSWELYQERLPMDRFTSKGFVVPSMMPELYHELDAYLVTSRVEGGPLTVLEALSTGVPVVSTNVGVSADLLVDRVTGLTIAKDSSADAINALEMLSKQPALKQAIAQQGRAVAEKQDWSAVAPKFGDLYKRLVGNNGRDSKKAPVQFQGEQLSSTDQRARVAQDEYVSWARHLARTGSLHTAYRYLNDVLPLTARASAVTRLTLYQAKLVARRILAS